jgi:outer membrane protein, multidrug efflux system
MKAAVGSIALTVLAGLSACTMEPHYKRPAAPVPATWASTAAASGNTRPATETGWRQFFPDPNMQRLIEIALANNRDLRVAALNVQSAQAQYRVQRADLFPTIAATGLEEIEKYPSGVLATGAAGSATGGSTTSAVGSTGGSTIRFFEAGVGFTNYELDLFGRIRSLSKAKFEAYLGSEESRRSTQISLVAEVVSAYLAVLADETILRVTRETLQSQTASYDLTKRSLDAGTTTAQAFRQAATTVDTAKANLAEYTRQAAEDRNALMLLLGASIPADITFDIDLDKVNLSADLPAGIPSEVLANRPDVLSAEHTLLAANANIGAARAAFFPSITLTGEYGTASTQLSGLFKPGTSAWSFSPQITLPLFAGGANKANLDLNKIQKDINVAQYEKTLQTAFQEVDDALASRRTLDEQLAAEQALLEDTTQSFKLADLRFRSGVDSYLPVLDAQRALYAAQQSVVSLELTRLQNMATLYKALGGGLKEQTPP